MSMLVWTLERGDVQTDVEIEYSMSPVIPATYYDPAEGGEVEIIAVWDGGNDIMKSLSSDEYQAVEAWVYANGTPDDPDEQYDDGRDFTPPYEP